MRESPVELSVADKKKVEEDVREMIGVKDEQIPVILDLESVKVIGPGKFVIDVVNLFRKDRPLIYKLEEGKYVIDLASTLQKYNREKEIFDVFKKKEEPKEEEIFEVSQADKDKINEMIKDEESAI